MLKKMVGWNLLFLSSESLLKLEELWIYTFYQILDAIKLTKEIINNNQNRINLTTINTVK